MMYFGNAIILMEDDTYSIKTNAINQHFHQYAPKAKHGATCKFYNYLEFILQLCLKIIWHCFYVQAVHV